MQKTYFDIYDVFVRSSSLVLVSPKRLSDKSTEYTRSDFKIFARSNGKDERFVDTLNRDLKNFNGIETE